MEHAVDRSIIFDQEQLDPFDILWQFKDVLAAIGGLETDLTGQTTTVVAGFAAGPTGPASLTINLAAGRLYQQSVMDSTAYGALASDSSVVQQQGVAPAQSVLLSTAGLSAGQSMWALVQAQFSQLDVVRTGDPTGGVLNYFNSNNPTQPFQGPNNDGASQPTERKATVSIEVIYGAPATTGSEVPPNPTGGWVPLFLVDLTFAQTAITSGQILVAGPSVGSNVPSNYPAAPFLAGLLNQHHKGTSGQAPQIDLTAEVKNTLPLANLPASSTSGGGIGVLKLHAGNPNGNLAGNFKLNGTLDLAVDTVGQLLYFCSVSGTSSTAVWASVSGATTSIFAGGTATGTVNAQIVASTTPSGFTKSPGQVVTFTGLNNTSSATLNIDGTGLSTVQKNTGGGNVNLTGGEMNGFVTVLWTGTIYLLQPGLLGQLATLNIGQWLKNDGTGNLTINVDSSLQDNGSGKLQLTPSFIPASGSMMLFGGSSPPSGWLLCNGQGFSRTAALFAAIGITFGSGDGVTTANVPDFRGRVPGGVDGGAGRLSGLTLGVAIGNQAETIGQSNLPAVSLFGSASGSISGAASTTGLMGHGPVSTTAGDGAEAVYFASGASIPGLPVTGSFTGSASVALGGSNVPMETVQPTLGVNVIIKL
jgi:microcystin-dependent protein